MEGQAQGVASVLEHNKGNITLLQCDTPTGDSDGLWARRRSRSGVTERGGPHQFAFIRLRTRSSRAQTLVH